MWAVANRLHTSFTATLDHLHNLGYVDDTAREAVRERIKARTAAKAARQQPAGKIIESTPWAPLPMN